MSKEEIAAQRAAEWREALRKEKKNKDRIEIERVRMTELAPEYRITNNEEVNCGLTMEQAQLEASRCLDCPDPQCMQGCPRLWPSEQLLSDFLWFLQNIPCICLESVVS